MKTSSFVQPGFIWRLRGAGRSRRRIPSLLAALCVISFAPTGAALVLDTENRDSTHANESVAKADANDKPRRATKKSSPITVEFQAGSDSDSVFIRSRGTNITAPSVAASAKAFLFNFSGHKAKNADIRVEGKRLENIRVRQHNGRVGVRLVQRDDAKGSLRKHVSHKQINGGIKVTIRHNLSAPTAKTEATTDAKSKAGEHAEQLAALLGATPAGTTTSESTAPIAHEPDRPQPAPDSRAEATAASNVVDPTSDQSYLAQALELNSPAPKPSDTTVETANDTGSERWLGLILLIGLALSAALLLRWLKTHTRTGVSPGGLEVLERMAMGPRTNLMRVRVGTREVLLGQSESGISLLAHLHQGSPIVLPAVADGRAATAPGSITNSDSATAGFDSSRPSPPPNPELERETRARMAVFKSRLSAAIAAEHAEHADSDSNAIETAARDAEISQNHTHLREVVDDHRPNAGSSPRSISA